MDDRELEAMSKANAAIKDLIEEERVRVIQWLAAKYMTNYSPPRVSTGSLVSGVSDDAESADISESDDTQQFESFAELLAASSSDTAINRVLLAAYWVQVVEGVDSFKTFELNKNLKDTGNFDENINKKLISLRGTRPAKVVQLAKTSTGAGKGHRTMKLTTHGISEAEKLLGKTQ
jgi:hypothetical protein